MSNLLMDFTDVLAECIEAIEQGQATVESCLTRYPEYAADLQELLPVMATLREAPPVAPAPVFRQRARQRLLRQLPPLPSENVTFFQSLRHSWQSIGLFQPTRRLSMTWIIIIATVVSVFTGGGAAYAADAAVPGDALYALDLSLEALRLNLASDADAQVALQLAFAEERLQEAQELVAAGDTADLQEALAGYGETISAVAQTVGTAEGADQEALTALLDQSLAVHDVVLTEMFTGSEAAAASDDVSDERCSVISDNPMAQRIAEQYDVSVEEVMGWFCDGAGFGEILLAYSISEQTGISVSDLFALRAEGLGWGQIMQDADLIGQPGETPEGRPDNAGAPENTPDGRPDDAGKPDNGEPPDDAGKPEATPEDHSDNADHSDDGNMPQEPPDGVPQDPSAPTSMPTMPPAPTSMPTMPPAPTSMPTMPPAPTSEPTMPPAPTSMSTMPPAPTSPSGGGGRP